ncbi:MAG: hypothetical protein ACRD22_00805 [Terriglobia bacterium]
MAAEPVAAALTADSIETGLTPDRRVLPIGSNYQIRFHQVSVDGDP